MIGIIARDAALGPLTGAPGARFDADPAVVDRDADQGDQRLHRLPHRDGEDGAGPVDKQLIVGDTGPGTGTRSYPKVLNELLGMKFKLVGGFRSSADVFLAMERGEVEGICESLDSVKITPSRLDPDARRQRAVPGRRASPIPSSRACRSCSISPATARSGQVIEFLYAGQGIGRPFVAPPDLPRTGSKCCATPSTPP